MRARAIDVAARLDAPADHHAEHEHQADDHGAAEEQIEDLATVEADLDLVLVQLGLALDMTPSVGNPGDRGNISTRYCEQMLITTERLRTRPGTPCRASTAA